MDSTERSEDAEAIDVAMAALDRLGQALGLGSTDIALAMFDGTPIALSRDENGGTVALVGQQGAVLGSLLAQLRRSKDTERPQ